MKYIGVFCSAQDLKEKYVLPAKQFAKLLSERGYSLVWGGSDTGLMHVIAEGVREGGGELIGVSVEFLQDVALKTADELIIAKDLGERKATMLKRSDAIVVLVGGTGTLDEMTDIMELKRHGHHDKPIVILNTENFYEGLKALLKKMKNEDFIKKDLEEILYFADTPEEAIAYIDWKLGVTPNGK